MQREPRALPILSLTDNIVVLIPQPPQPFYSHFFWDYPGDLVPEENFWTLWCKGRLTEADTLTRWAPLHPD